MKNAEQFLNVAVLGASQKPERYSNKALHALLEKGHTVFPVHPAVSEIDGIKVFRTLEEISDKIHTLTVYLSPETTEKLCPSLINLRPERVIFNPGAEAPMIYPELERAGITVTEACTLVLLSLGSF